MYIHITIRVNYDDDNDDDDDNNNNWLMIIITGTVFMVLSIRQSHCERWPSSFDGRTTVAYQAAVDAQFVHTRHRHLVLLRTKADTHFTLPRRLERWVTSDPSTAARVCSPCPRIYRSAFRDKCTTHDNRFHLGTSHIAARHVTSRHLRWWWWWWWRQ